VIEHDVLDAVKGPFGPVGIGRGTVWYGASNISGSPGTGSLFALHATSVPPGGHSKGPLPVVQ
jgi:hypothetical protein